MNLLPFRRVLPTRSLVHSGPQDGRGLHIQSFELRDLSHVGQEKQFKEKGLTNVPYR